MERAILACVSLLKYVPWLDAYYLEKFQFGQASVDFLVFTIIKADINTTKKFIQIYLFPSATLTDVHPWFGVVNQVIYVFVITKQMEPFRRLPFHWTPDLETVFRRLLVG